MKTRAAKQTELTKGKTLLAESQFLVFTDLTKVATEDLRRLRSELRKIGAGFLVIKKRLLGIILKEQGAEFDAKKFKMSLGTIFGPDMEKTSGSVYKFFKELNVEKEKILGGYNLKDKNFVEKNQVLAIGQLPPREVLLAELLGMIAAPIRSLLYILKEKSQRSS